MASPTDQQLLDTYRSALMAVAGGQSYTINGRSLTRQNIGDIQRTIVWLEQRIATAAAIADDDEAPPNIVLAQFVDP